MRFLFDLTHPVHVHMFRGLISHLQGCGHDITIVARDKDVTIDLLNASDLSFSMIGRQGKGAGLFYEWIGHAVRLFNIARSLQPDVVIGESNPCVAQVAKLLGKRSIVFLDTEHAFLQNSLTFPFADLLCTPKCYPKDLGPGHVTYNGFKELIYLHPKYFSPDPSILEDVGLKNGERFSLVRTVSWSAAHDIGQRGLGKRVEEVIRELEDFGKVLVSSEDPLPSDCERYGIKVPPHRIHDLMSYASLYLGDGASMAAEAAVLGVPSIYVSTLHLKYLEELERTYGLGFQLQDVVQAIEKAKGLLMDSDTAVIWQANRRKMLKETEDINRFIIDLVDNL